MGSQPWRMQPRKNLATRLGGVGSSALARKPLVGRSFHETEKDENKPQRGSGRRETGQPHALSLSGREGSRLPIKPLEPKTGKP